jgi:nucleotide-binding universal stress UspA family protein
VILMADLLDGDIATLRSQLRWRRDAGRDQRCAVAGFDGSTASAAALAYASGWAERNLGAVVVVHVDAAAGAAFAEGACAMAWIIAPEMPARDMSADVDEVMTYTSVPWAYVNVRGGVADGLERVAGALEADAIVVGRSTRRRLRIAPSVTRRLLATSRHVIVVV